MRHGVEHGFRHQGNAGAGRDTGDDSVIRAQLQHPRGGQAAFTAHPDSLYGGVHAAAVSILAQARTSALFGAVVSAEHGASNDLLPLFTTRSTALVELATSLVAEYVFHYDGIDRDDPTILPAIDTVVRIALSHVMQPGGSPDEVGHHIAWMVERLVEEAWRDIPARA